MSLVRRAIWPFIHGTLGWLIATIFGLDMNSPGEVHVVVFGMNVAGLIDFLIYSPSALMITVSTGGVGLIIEKHCCTSKIKTKDHSHGVGLLSWLCAGPLPASSLRLRGVLCASVLS